VRVRAAEQHADGHAVDETRLDDAAKLMKTVLATTDEEVEAERIEAALDAKVTAEYAVWKATHAAKTGPSPSQRC
jgi:hypothetical protein